MKIGKNAFGYASAAVDILRNKDLSKGLMKIHGIHSGRKNKPKKISIWNDGDNHSLNY